MSSRSKRILSLALQTNDNTSLEEPGTQSEQNVISTIHQGTENLQLSSSDDSLMNLEDSDDKDYVPSDVESNLGCSLPPTEDYNYFPDDDADSSLEGDAHTIFPVCVTLNPCSKSSMLCETETTAAELNSKARTKSTIPQLGRKRVRNPKEWLANIRKSNYAAGKAYITKKGKHVNAKSMKRSCSCRMKCHNKITETERKAIFCAYWDENKNTDMKRQFIRSCIDARPVARCRSRLGTRIKSNTMIYSFIVNLTKVTVCRVMFLNTLSLSNTVIINALKKQQQGGIVENDKRGKHTPSNKISDDVRSIVEEHIASIPAYESHYSREKTVRNYLGPELSIEKMYVLYLQLCTEKNIEKELVAKKWLYYDIFNKKFKLSFKPPEIDTCDDCDAFKAKSKSNLTTTEHELLKCEYDSHIKESDERYGLKRNDIQLSKNNSKIKVLTVDLQKCLPTPLLSCGLSFYKRKLWTLNYTIYDGSDGSAHCMMWDESISGRGGSEVASAILKWASCYIPNSEIEDLIIWSDNCYGQNKNMDIIMVSYWLLSRYPQLKTINQKFLLKGHTHMEADTVHALIERKRKKINDSTVLIPWDWQQLIRQCSNKYFVYNMELSDFFNFKSLYKTAWTSPFISRKLDVDKQNVLISNAVYMQARQGDIGTLYFKTSFDSEDFRAVNHRRNTRRNDVQLPRTLEVLSSSTKAITTNKYNDLLDLLPFIPSHCHDFYLKLKHGNNVPGYPPGDDEEEN